MQTKKIFIVLFIIVSVSTFSQKKEAHLRAGNEEFSQQKYTEAEANYRIEKSKAEDKSIASYNLGNAIYKQESYSESKFAYADAIEKSNDKTEKHKAYHNLGNVLMKEKNYLAAVEAYKNALRNNPHDEQTRYNYAIAKDLLDKNPPPEGGGSSDKNENDENQDQNQQNQNNDQNQDGQDNQDNQDDQNQDSQDNQNENQNSQQNQGDAEREAMQKQRIENILDAVENQEKGIQERVQKNKELEQKKGQIRQPEKNW